MEADFWHTRWENNQIGFHEGKTNAFLQKHFPHLGLEAGARVFVPLCGKSRDIAWLLGHGLKVAGAELSALAVEQLFAELGVAPTVTAEGPLTRYSAPSIDIFQGDIFALSAERLGPADAVYDRAALVALPPAMRARYAAHLVDVTAGAPQLVICFVYDQSKADGPPFSVGDAEARALYGAHYTMALLESAEVEGGLKGKLPASEHIWLLSPA